VAFCIQVSPKFRDIAQIVLRDRFEAAQLQSQPNPNLAHQIPYEEWDAQGVNICPWQTYGGLLPEKSLAQALGFWESFSVKPQRHLLGWACRVLQVHPILADRLKCSNDRTELARDDARSLGLPEYMLTAGNWRKLVLFTRTKSHTAIFSLDQLPSGASEADRQFFEFNDQLPILPRYWHPEIPRDILSH
jgi:hypothetical protein